MDKKKGHYIGTEINEKWWSRYRGEGFFARGNGEYWFDEDFFYFRRYLTKEPNRNNIVVALHNGIAKLVSRQ